MRNDLVIWFALGSYLNVITGCGGRSEPPPQTPAYGIAEPQAKKAAAPADGAGRFAEPPTHPSANATEAAPAPPAAAPAPASVQEDRSEAPSAGDPHARYARANVQFSEARRQVDIAAGQRDCANACRALDSMERALGQLCELARTSDERRTCRAAEDQVGSARERVKNACGECPKKTK
jgi:hypothetical protein